MIGYYTYRFKRNLDNIWDNLRQKYNGFYRIVEQTSREEPVFHDDYIEPYEYKQTTVVVFEDLETGEQSMLSKSVFMHLFEIVEGE